MHTCEICGQKLKRPPKKRHFDSKKHKAALRKQKKVPISTLKQKTQRVVVGTSAVEDRVTQLEEQVRFIMNKLTTIEVQIANLNPVTADLQDPTPLKARIKEMLPQGESITIDELVTMEGLREYGFEQIENAIHELVDEEIVDVTEGKSRLKLHGNIGRLIRR